jgi:hypothetical protein
MQTVTRKISQAIYERALQHSGHIADEDINDVFLIQEQIGYGVYGDYVHETDGEYFVTFKMGDTCD